LVALLIRYPLTQLRDRLLRVAKMPWAGANIISGITRSFN